MSRSVRTDYEVLRRPPCTCPRSVYNPTTTRPTNPDCVKHGDRTETAGE